jgi:D-amino-acid dehydrogenase
VTHVASRRRPERVAVIGAGVAGLSTAWFLQEHGICVTVYDRGGIGAGSSRGNAGWIVPELVEPLPSPAMLKNIIPAMLRPAGALRIPLVPRPALWRFLAGTARQCTAARWQQSMHSLVGITPMALAAFELLGDAGVDVNTDDAEPLLACFRTAAQRDAMALELRCMRAAGQPVKSSNISGDDARGLEPCLSGEVTAAIAVEGQRFLDPLAFVSSLADSVRGRGAQLCFGHDVTDVIDDGDQVLVSTTSGDPARFDAAVIATGAWFNRLAKTFGVRVPVHAGRGYSFSIAVTPTPARPLYFPVQRVACTPIQGRLRLAGMMEFRDADTPFDPRRIAAMVKATAPMLHGAEFGDRHDEWVGPRPCTADGLPLIGATSSPRVFGCGGHGMWGMVLGPVSGQLLAQQISSGSPVPALSPFDPGRGRRSAA